MPSRPGCGPQFLTYYVPSEPGCLRRISPGPPVKASHLSRAGVSTRARGFNFFCFLESTFKDQINPKRQTAGPHEGAHRNWTSLGLQLETGPGPGPAPSVDPSESGRNRHRDWHSASESDSESARPGDVRCSGIWAAALRVGVWLATAAAGRGLAKFDDAGSQCPVHCRSVRSSSGGPPQVRVAPCARVVTLFRRGRWLGGPDRSAGDTKT